MKISSWAGFEKSLENISQKVSEGEKTTVPFPLLALTDDALLLKQSSEIYSSQIYPLNLSLGEISKYPRRNKIILGYFSADFHDHATSYLMAELFELHDKQRFELVAFSFGPIANDAMRQRLIGAFDHFYEVGSMSDIEIAKLSRELSIDIAIDLKGFTKNSRTGIFSCRAAPIQVNYLGYPGSMGSKYIDYLIADKSLIPDQSQQFFSEKIVYLPNSYQANDTKRLISNEQFTREEFGLPENDFVFCCFNNNYKILPTTFCGWMNILNSVPRSVLWLLKDNPWAVENLKKEAEKCGVSQERLVFAERISLPDHLARHRQADLFLDTFPCNAHTTASDALWGGLPVLTRQGQSFASRVAASLLNAVGLPELITATQSEYEALAINLATNAQKLADIKQNLTNNRLSTSLFDTQSFINGLEVAYRKMYDCYHSDLVADHIYID
jgi:predicted O-linked N-acetylglucosamine transferase (SPINDLY family)